MIQPKYVFDELFQIRIVNHIINDPQFLMNYRDTLEPLYFEYEELVVIARLALEYYDKYNLRPDKDTMEALLTDHVNKTITIKEDFSKNLYAYLARVYNQTLEHDKKILDLVIPFGRRQKISLALLESATLVTDLEENEDRIYNLIFGAFSVGTGKSVDSSSFVQNFATLPQRLKALNEDDDSRRISTGIPNLDKYLKGGIGVGEIGFIESLPGVGKSNSLINFTAAAMIQQKNVLVVTNELHVLDWETRLAARLSGIPMDDLDNPKFFKQYEKSMQWMAKLMNFVEIHYYAPRKLTPAGLRTLVSRIESIKGKKVDLIVLDYFKRMGSIDVNNPWNTEGEVVKQLIALLSDFQTRMWCFTGDTKVSLLNGTEVPIKELVGKKDIWLYGCKPDGTIYPVKTSGSSLALKNQPLVEVTLDNGESIRCTLDHPFMLRDGTYEEAQYLEEGTSLMPLYRRLDAKGYEQYKDNSVTGHGWLHTHREFNALSTSEEEVYHLGNHTHHKDRNKRNNEPVNLQTLTPSEHAKLPNLSAPVEDLRLNTIWWEDEESWASTKTKEVHSLRQSKDHKVSSVKFLDEKEDVFCINVPHTNNFALSAGIIVHNTADQPSTLDRSIEDLDLEHGGGSKSKQQDADLWITLNQSVAQHQNNRAHYFCAKVRRGEALNRVDLYYDKTRSLILDWEHYYETQLKNQAQK